MNTVPDQSIKEVADEIEKNKKDILFLFERKLREVIDIPKDLTTEHLTSVIPQQIETLIQTLVRHTKSKNHVTSLAREHAKLRASSKVFTLDILISEFVILRDVIFEVLEKKGPVDVKASNIIWKFIVHSIRVAISEFENQRMNEAEDMGRELDESELLNKKISAQILESKENEERYRTLIEGVEDYAVFTLDPDGFITSWNPGAEKMKGYTFKEAIGSHFSMLYTEEEKSKDAPMDHLHVALIEGKYRGEGVRRRKNGEIFLADVYIRPIFKDGKHLGFAKVVADVTERNRFIQSAKASNTQMVDLQSEKAQREKFVMRLSHDLRGPLSIARASVQLIGRNLQPNEKNRRFVDKAILSIDRINKMIGDLLDANRMMGGEKPHLNIQTWDLVRLIQNVCEDFRVLGARIDVLTEINELKGEWDGEGLRRVLENLISNAMKYGDNSFPIEVSIFDLGDKARVQVHNMGEVIKDNDQKSLFDQFRRIESSERRIQGWGIGLSLVKGITEAHGGTVGIESYPIAGTTFTVTLPKRISLPEVANSQ
jgi:PAS domain S-box-containing protein